jgi:Tol biopolymer transport system component
MTHDEDGRLAAWLGDSFDPASVAALERAFARARLTRQRPAWAVNLTGGTIAQRPASGLLRRTPVLAAVVLIGLLAGAQIVGGVLLPPKPAPSPLINTSASPEPSAQPKSAVIVFMTRIGGVGPQLWVANADGTGKHELVPDLGGTQGLPSWSPDGARLLFSRNQGGFMTGDLGDAGTRLYLTDAHGSAPQLVDTGCVSPCVSDSHGVFSSDGRRILFLRLNIVDAPPGATPGFLGKPAQPMQVRVLVMMDLGTGRVTELGDAPAGSFPDWSPDRTQIVFDREIPPTSPSDTDVGSQEVLVADTDGRNVHRVSPLGWSSFSGGWSPDGTGSIFSGAWSPDGTRILFHGIQYTWAGNEIRAFSDIYTVNPDGTDLRRLTTDDNSSAPAWSVDGRIWFIGTPRVDGNLQTDRPDQYWIMDADGGNATQSSLAPQPQELAGTAWQPTP